VWDAAASVLEDRAIDRDVERLAVALRAKSHLYVYGIDRILA
jgi:hypothetical protein